MHGATFHSDIRLSNAGSFCLVDEMREEGKKDDV
jgi:hypothetical protein